MIKIIAEINKSENKAINMDFLFVQGEKKPVILEIMGIAVVE